MHGNQAVSAFLFVEDEKKEVRIHRRSCSQKSGKSALRGSVMLMIMKRHKEYISALENAWKTEYCTVKLYY